MATLKEGNEKKPPPERLVPITYRPQDSFEHFVSDGENWQKVADRYRVEVRSLIQANFKTLIPEEINWYLREYVNCDTPTPDRYNWRFSTSARHGPSPRAGVVYIVPNWPSIGAAAKMATKQWVADWFHFCQLTLGTIHGPVLEIRPGSVQSRSRFDVLFKQHLLHAGAPDKLIEAWTDCLKRALVIFTSGIHDLQASAFPSFVNWPPGLPAGPMPAQPWPLLQFSGMDGVVKAPHFREILPRAQLTGSAARVTLANYARWFERAFSQFRAKALATGVTGTGRADPAGMVQGFAFGFIGFLSRLEMLD